MPALLSVDNTGSDIFAFRTYIRLAMKLHTGAIITQKINRMIVFSRPAKFSY